MQPDLRRLVPDLPFPPYTFVPGKTPHPVSDPAGHSHGRTLAPAEPLTVHNWRRNECYLFAIDLFNYGYYWEAHEAWEALWHAAGRKDDIAIFLKGLIHLAAAGVKQLERRPKGVLSHGRRAAELFRSPADAEVFMGQRLPELISLAESIGRDGWTPTPPLLWPERGD